MVAHAWGIRRRNWARVWSRLRQQDGRNASADNTLKVFQGQPYYENIFHQIATKAHIVALHLIKEVRLQLGV